MVLEPGPVNLAEMDKQRKGCKKKRKKLQTSYSCGEDKFINMSRNLWSVFASTSGSDGTQALASGSELLRGMGKQNGATHVVYE